MLGWRMLNIAELKEQLNQSRGLVRLGDVEDFLDSLPEEPLFDLTITSPPYDIGKPYEKRVPLAEYLSWQKRIIEKIVKRMKPNGSICWQVGNYVSDGCVWPLDIAFAPIFCELGLQLRNRIIWHFGHGMHSKRRFSGRHETILWFTNGGNYTFNLEDVLVPQKYPGKLCFKGPNRGKLSGNPKGKNPEDVWDIPNVVGNHLEKKGHPCQFPVGLVVRLVRALSNEDEIVFDPFAGSCSTAVAALSQKRRFIGCELNKDYVKISRKRISDTLAGREQFRSADKPVYDHMRSHLSERPKEWGCA